jgi:hypothetical protein
VADHGDVEHLHPSGAFESDIRRDLEDRKVRQLGRMFKRSPTHRDRFVEDSEGEDLTASFLDLRR